MVTVAVDMAEVFVLSLLAFLSDVISLGRSLEIPRVDFGGDCRLLTPSCWCCCCCCGFGDWRTRSCWDSWTWPPWPRGYRKQTVIRITDNKSSFEQTKQAEYSFRGRYYTLLLSKVGPNSYSSQDFVHFMDPTSLTCPKNDIFQAKRSINIYSNIFFTPTSLLMLLPFDVGVMLPPTALVLVVDTRGHVLLLPLLLFFVHGRRLAAGAHDGGGGGIWSSQALGWPRSEAAWEVIESYIVQYHCDTCFQTINMSADFFPLCPATKVLQTFLTFVCRCSALSADHPCPVVLCPFLEADGAEGVSFQTIIVAPSSSSSSVGEGSLEST